MEVPWTWRAVRVSSPCGTLEEDEGGSQSQSGGRRRVYLQAGGWARARAPVVETTFIGGRWTPDAYRTDGRARASPRTDGGSRSMLLTDAIMKTYFCRCRSRLRDPLPSGVVRYLDGMVLCMLVISYCARRCFCPFPHPPSLPSPLIL